MNFFFVFFHSLPCAFKLLIIWTWTHSHSARWLCLYWWNICCCLKWVRESTYSHRRVCLTNKIVRIVHVHESVRYRYILGCGWSESLNLSIPKLMFLLFHRRKSIGDILVINFAPRVVSHTHRLLFRKCLEMKIFQVSRLSREWIGDENVLEIPRINTNCFFNSLSIGKKNKKKNELKQQ